MTTIPEADNEIANIHGKYNVILTEGKNLSVNGSEGSM
jgi:hypothetical protein